MAQICHARHLRNTYRIRHLNTTQDNLSRQKQLKIVIIVWISLSLPDAQQYSRCCYGMQ